MAPRFVRCDLSRSGWQALTLYGSGPAFDVVPDWPAPMPVFCSSARFTACGASEWTTYFDTRMHSAARIEENLSAVAAALGLSPARGALIIDVLRRMLPLGWIQCVAVTNCPRRLKLDVATNRASDTLRALRDFECPELQRIAAAICRLGGAVGYAGASVSQAGTAVWRVYARPFPCRDIAGLLEDLIR
jgi:hypothetical protein